MDGSGWEYLERYSKDYDKHIEKLNNQIERLQKQLDIATKALNDIINDGDDYWDKGKAQHALTKMEGVK